MATVPLNKSEGWSVPPESVAAPVVSSVNFPPGAIVRSTPAGTVMLLVLYTAKSSIPPDNRFAFKFTVSPTVDGESIVNAGVPSLLSDAVNSTAGV